MKFVTDVHLHSHFSRATSKDLTLEHLSKWAQLKGVHVVGTGDIAHPGWLAEMKKKLEPAEAGLFRLKTEFTGPIQQEVFKACHAPVRFMLAGEISNIYKKGDRVRKIHNVVFLPTFEAVERLQAALENIGNIRSDGRPILGLDSRDLLEIVLEVDPEAYLIPAHIWTPWFSLLGSMSGFDSVEECFEVLTPHIFALETGLSSDPPMNWRLSALDRYTLVSNSDAHSPQKLAREANVFDTELSYPTIFEALKTGDPQRFLGTIEFFPEEGKYHFDGHRKCGVRWDPKTTLEHKGVCPACGKPVTVGVMHRVELLADRDEGAMPEQRHPFRSLMPLPEVLAEVFGVRSTTKRVHDTFEMLLSKLGPELTILQDAPLETIERLGGGLLAEGIRRMRAGEVTTEAGYDGEYGAIRLFRDDERAAYSTQLGFFPADAKAEKAKVADRSEAAHYGTPANRSTSEPAKPAAPAPAAQPAGGGQQTKSPALLHELNDRQREAVLCTDRSLIIVAGPGTGKTRTLTHRMAHLILEKAVPAERLLAITFTNKAAEEMATRLKKLLGEAVAEQITIKTFHAFGVQILQTDGARLGLSPTFGLCSDADRRALLRQLFPDMSERKLGEHLDLISVAKSALQSPGDQEDPDFAEIFERYEQALADQHLLDFDDLIVKPVQLFERFPDLREAYQARYPWISVDEYQDINLAQYRILRHLTGPGTNLCVIGDPDQAIYGFRGASRAFFLRFEEDFPEARRIVLGQNYRSTRPIVEASGQVIARSPDRQPVEVWSDLVSQTRLQIYHAPTDRAEAEYVVQEIEKLVGGTSYFSLDSGRVDDGSEGRTFADFAVLYRIGALSRPLIEAFERSGIPYQTVGETPFFARKEVRRVLGYLWLGHNPKALLHAQEIFGDPDPALPNLLGGTSDEAIEKLLDSDEPFETPQGPQGERLIKVVGLLRELRRAAGARPVTELLEMIGAQSAVTGADPDVIERLKRKAALFDSRLDAFLQTSVLSRETDEYDPRADRVALMTLHAAKGLEFPVVFIVGCEENLIPYTRRGQPPDVEEERRLLYVGMTRARERLILTSAKKRSLFGQTMKNGPSPFLNDIEEALKEFHKRQQKARRTNKARAQLTLFEE